mmetsp:Transcript_45930/g.84245  ORF Transcript_45930/g.84245 Transcript_45930/m.84245 type:complete len:553 (-) Transcript_45930:9-1667(-)
MKDIAPVSGTLRMWLAFFVAASLHIDVVAQATRAYELWENGCWHDVNGLNYLYCCSDLVSPNPGCFVDGRTFESCCRCPAPDAHRQDYLAMTLSQQFFGPLICSLPRVKSRLDDFMLHLSGGGQRLMRIYIYPLPRKFNGEIVNKLFTGGVAFEGSTCDPGLTTCTEQAWAGLYSVYRQFASEVLVLQKFLTAPHGVLTDNPEEADLYVVPYLVKSDCIEAGSAGHDPCWANCKCAKAQKFLWPQLRHYNWKTRGRHLFFGTGDAKDIPLDIQATPLHLSLGASYCPGHIVVPSPSVDPVLQADGIFELRDATNMAPARHNFVYWFGSLHNEYRQVVIEQLLELRGHGKKVVVHGIDTYPGAYEKRDIWTSSAGSPSTVLEEMYRSVFCPVLHSDVPHQKRLFDAMLTGCIPVVVAFPSHVPGEVTWWKADGPPLDRMLPFWEDIDYRSFTVEVTLEELQRRQVVERLLGISDAELEQRRAAMRRFKQLIRYDFTASGPDAFSMIMKEVKDFLQKQEKVQGNAVFDCGVPPLELSDEEGIAMYGTLACCLVG